MLERLNVFLGGCGGKGAQDGDCIEALNQDRDALEKEGAYYYYYYHHHHHHLHSYKKYKH